jgi:hypothetical protein
VLLGVDSEYRWIRFAYCRFGHLFPYLPGQPLYHKRLRAAAPLLAQAISHLAKVSPSWCDSLRLLDATPVPCAASRQTVCRSQIAGLGGYGLRLLRPDRRNEPARHGNLGGARQWIESVYDSLKGQLGLQRHGAGTPRGVFTCPAQRLLALDAAIWHN